MTLQSWLKLPFKHHTIIPIKCRNEWLGWHTAMFHHSYQSQHGIKPDMLSADMSVPPPPPPVFHLSDVKIVKALIPTFTTLWYWVAMSDNWGYAHNISGSFLHPAHVVVHFYIIWKRDVYLTTSLWILSYLRISALSFNGFWKFFLLCSVLTYTVRILLYCKSIFLFKRLSSSIICDQKSSCTFPKVLLFFMWKFIVWLGGWGERKAW